MNTKRDVLPIWITAAIVPLITYFTFQETEFSVFPWFPNQEAWLDVALYGKSRALMLLGIWMVTGLVVRGIQKKLKRPGKVFLFLAVLGVFQILAALFSRYPHYSVTGIMEQYEPIGVLLAYLVICIYTYEYVVCGGEVRQIGYAMFAGLSVLCFLGLTQLFQHDFWATDLGRVLMVPERFAEYRESLRFNFSTNEWGRVYTSLYNPNYAGIFLVLMGPLVFLWGNRKLWLLGGAACLCLAGTFSKTAFAAAVVVLLAGVVLFYGKRLNRKMLCLFAVAAVVFLAGILWMGSGSMEEQVPLEEVEAGTDAVRIVYNHVTVYLSHAERETGGIMEDIRYEDGSIVPLDWAPNRGECDPVEKELQGIYFKVYEKDGISYVQFRCQDMIFRFTDSLGTGKFEYVSSYGKLDELRDAKKVFGGLDRFFSGRGYIWSRSLALIGQYPVLGTGPDTFMLVFPQDDYVARARLGTGFFKEILTNGHSFYLDTAVETGIPSLLCFLIFVGWYIRDSWKLYYGRKTYSKAERMGAAVFLGILGYLVCGLTWASSVCTAPVFWMLLGMGIGINERWK